MSVDLETPRHRRSPRDDAYAVSPPLLRMPQRLADTPPDPLALTEGVEVTICLTDQPQARADLSIVADHLWRICAKTRFELAAVHPLPGGARLHFLIRDGGPSDDGHGALELLQHIGAHYRWVGVNRQPGQPRPSGCRH